MEDAPNILTPFPDNAIFPSTSAAHKSIYPHRPSIQTKLPLASAKLLLASRMDRLLFSDRETQ
ncbi:MAG: hypothetical protein LBG28_00790 [Tannerella sp.]|nr:hypothetical protein [Tannerella sp.]